MLINALVLGIDLGTSGVRIAIINKQKQIVYTSSMKYPRGLEEWEDWIICCKQLLKEIPKDIKERLISCAVAGTSGTLLACHKNGEPLGKALPYSFSYPEYSNEINKLFIKDCPASSTSGSVGRALKLISLYGNKILLMHQADWISGWILNNWESGEEGNNLRMGWEISTRSWPETFNNLNWFNCLDGFTCLNCLNYLDFLAILSQFV